MYIAAKHVQAWLEEGKARLIPSEIANQFGTFLDQLPWRTGGGGLDWNRISGQQISLSQMALSRQIARLALTPIGQDPYVVFWYRPDEPCIACQTAFAFLNIDQAFWKAPGTRFMFGGRFDGASFEGNFNHLAEYDGADIILVRE